jgi:pantoate--beta-alanine ligase
MARRPPVARSISALRQAIAAWRRKGDAIALVPTMGALHEGHLSLVRLARKKARRVVVSLFVNPTQFAPSEDFATYPRTWDDDLAALAELDVDLIWAPPVKVMYPDGFTTRIELCGPAKAGLEDRFRPHFFGGVATVVSKLFIQVAPDFAIFGQKDYQQLKVVTRMARDLDLPLKIVGAPTVREKDGLAMSSRNVYLSAAERAAAPVLYRTLKASAARLKTGEAVDKVMADGRAAIEAGGFKIDYFEARHAETLEAVTPRAKSPVRLLVAARIGTTRLIDNLAV